MALEAITRKVRALHPMNNVGVDWEALPVLDGEDSDPCAICGEPLYLDLSFPLLQLRCRGCGAIALVTEPSDELWERWEQRKATNDG